MISQSPSIDIGDHGICFVFPRCQLGSRRLRLIQHRVRKFVSEQLMNADEYTVGWCTTIVRFVGFRAHPTRPGLQRGRRSIEYSRIQTLVLEIKAAMARDSMTLMAILVRLVIARPQKVTVELISPLNKHLTDRCTNRNLRYCAGSVLSAKWSAFSIACSRASIIG